MQAVNVILRSRLFFWISLHCTLCLCCTNNVALIKCYSFPERKWPEDKRYNWRFQCELGQSGWTKDCGLLLSPHDWYTVVTDGVWPLLDQENYSFFFFFNDRCTLQLQLAASCLSSLVLLDLKLQLLGKRRCDINSSLQGFSKESPFFFLIFVVVFRHAVSPCLSQRQVCPRLRFMIIFWYLFIVMNANRQ